MTDRGSAETGSVLDDLGVALETTPRLPRDQVTVALAKRYASALDDCFEALVGFAAVEDPATHARIVLEITRLGGRLEAMLDRLGMAPSARPAATGDGGDHGPTAEAAAFQQLRADAAAGAPASGVDYAASVDPAVTAADAED